MGISGQFESLINQPLIRFKPLPVIRRFSGGGTVIIDENTQFVSFICNSKELQVECYPDKVFKWSASFYQPVFADTGFRLLENDYVVKSRKFGGNAQYMRKDRWLHHSSLLWDFNPLNMEYLMIPSKTPEYRQRRHHTDFLCCLKDYMKKTTFNDNLDNELQKRFKVEIVTYEEAKKVQEEPHRKATSLYQVPK
jgi:lipoate-protein ligase A